MRPVFCGLLSASYCRCCCCIQHKVRLAGLRTLPRVAILSAEHGLCGQAFHVLKDVQPQLLPRFLLPLFSLIHQALNAVQLPASSFVGTALPAYAIVAPD